MTRKVRLYSPTTGKHRDEIRTRAIVKGNIAKGFEIFADESHLYHILLERQEHIPSEKRYETRQLVQCFSPVDFRNMQSHDKLIEFDKVEILHDPTRDGAIVDESLHFEDPNAGKRTKKIAEN